MLVSEKPRGPNASTSQANATANQANASARNPNGTRWNIGCVGSPRVGARIGHVDFMLFVSISFALGSQRKCVFQWNMGFSEIHI